MFDIYSTNQSNSERYAIGAEGPNKLFVVGLNPSTATSKVSDTTITKVRNVAGNNHFQGFVMINLYPLRSTDPDQLPLQANQETIATNISQILRLAEKASNPVFWAAWGEDVVIRSYLKEALLELNQVVLEADGNWIHLGALTQSGHPRHPSRLAYSWQFSQFNMSKYLQSVV